MQALGQALVRLGCQIVASGDESNRSWFCDLESLVFYLKAITLPEVFDPGRQLEPLTATLPPDPTATNPPSTATCSWSQT